MSTEEFLLSNWPLHWVSLGLAALLVAAVALQPRAASARRGLRLTGLGLAVAVLLLSLDSPVAALAEGYLFSAHMLQHLLLLLVVPGLLLCALADRPTATTGEPETVRPWGPWGRIVAHPLLTWPAGVGTMWFWHVPALCNAATSSPTLRTVQTVSLLGLGLLFWLPILNPNGRRRLPPLAGVLYLFTACVGCTLLGIILTFAPVNVCSAYLHPVDKLGVLSLIRDRWGITPSLDQQIGGLLMWVPACSIYLCGILGLLARWYSSPATPPLPPAAQEEPAVKPTPA